MNGPNDQPSRSGLARLAAGKPLDPGLDPSYLRKLEDDDPPDDEAEEADEAGELGEADEGPALLEAARLDDLGIDWDAPTGPPDPLGAWAADDENDDFRHAFGVTF